MIEVKGMKKLALLLIVSLFSSVFAQAGFRGYEVIQTVSPEGIGYRTIYLDRTSNTITVGDSDALPLRLYNVASNVLTDPAVSLVSGELYAQSGLRNPAPLQPQYSYDYGVPLYSTFPYYVYPVYSYDSYYGSPYNDLAIAYSPDNSLVAIGETIDNPVINIYEVSTGRLLVSFAGHRRAVNALAFSPDGSLIASASDDGTVRLWNLNEGRAERVLLHSGDAYSVTFNEDGSQLASVAAVDEFRRTIKLWDLGRGTNIRTLAVDVDPRYGYDIYASDIFIVGGVAPQLFAPAFLLEARNTRIAPRLRSHDPRVGSVRYIVPGHRFAPLYRQHGDPLLQQQPGYLVPGYILPGQDPFGVTPRGTLPQGVLPQGVLPQGMMPQGMMPQGMMPNMQQPGMATPQQRAPRFGPLVGQDVFEVFPDTDALERIQQAFARGQISLTQSLLAQSAVNAGNVNGVLEDFLSGGIGVDEFARRY